MMMGTKKANVYEKNLCRVLIQLHEQLSVIGQPMAEITRTFYSHLVFLFTADDHEIDVFTSKEGKLYSQMIFISFAPFKSIHSLQTSRKSAL